MANGLAGVDIDPDWCRTMTNGLSVAELRRIADLAAEQASQAGTAVTDADIETALQRHLTVADGRRSPTGETPKTDDADDYIHN